MEAEAKETGASPPKRKIEDDGGADGGDDAGGLARVTAAWPILAVGTSPSWEAVMRARVGAKMGPSAVEAGTVIVAARAVAGAIVPSAAVLLYREVPQFG